VALFVSLYFGFHDSAVSFADDGEVLLHLQAERVFRVKHMRASHSTMEELLRIGLRYLGRSVEDIETVFVGRWGCLPTARLTLSGRRFEPTWTDHHPNHVGLARVLNWPDALAVCADGGSENGRAGIYHFDGERYQLVEDLDDSLLSGRFYGALTQLVIGDDFHAAHVHWPGKTMALAAFGRFDRRLARALAENAKAFTEAHVSGVTALRAAFGLDAEYSDRCWRRWNLAHTAQKVWEALWLDKLSEHVHLSRNLIFSGGCALNVKLNEVLATSDLFARVFTPPNPGDDGQSMGALLHRLSVRCDYPYLGRSFGEMTEVHPRAVDDLVKGRLVMWFNGRSEIGPRALGHRSILGIPASIGARVALSEQVKRREWYRPVAGVVLEEEAHRWFDLEGASPFMLRAVPVRDITWERAPAIVHIDGTCRVQTVSRAQDSVMYDLLVQVGQATGVPVLMNTSMNLPGEPIVDTPEDAMTAFIQLGADVLYLNGDRLERH
jgi:carbamoyltransferase